MTEKQKFYFDTKKEPEFHLDIKKGNAGKQFFYADVIAYHSEVTGSCIKVSVKSKNKEENACFIVDFGLFQEQKYNEMNEKMPFDAEEIDFAIITHNHVDHTGRLPFLVKNGFKNKILTTSITKKLIEPALTDSCKVLGDIAKRNHQNPLYELKDVRKTMDLICGYDYEEEINVKNNIKIIFYKNGHLLGSALVLVQISSIYYEQDINIVFTGDYKKDNIFLDIPQIPNFVTQLPVCIIQESTYGTTNSKDVEKVFEKNIYNAVKSNKDIVIPVFSLGRSQEIAYVLRKMQEENLIPKNYPIYLDGPLTFKYTKIYLEENVGIKEEMKNFLPYGLKFINSDNREIVLKKEGPKIVLTSSGMGSYGPAQMHIPAVLARKNGLIHFTGYMAENTLGRRLKDTKNGEAVSVGGVTIKKRGEVQYTTEFSSHAKADEMIEFLNKFKNIKIILLNHGERDTKIAFAGRILEAVNAKDIGILGEEYAYRINPYGLVKVLPKIFY